MLSRPAAETSPWRGRTRPTLLTLALVAGLALSACARPLEEEVSSPVTSPPGPNPAVVEMEVVLEVDFDEARGTLADGAPVVDDSGHSTTGTIRLGGPAPEPLAVVERGDGAALRLARVCEPDASPCPKGIVEFASSALLNPGADDFRFGASVLMTPGETSPGSNIVQKGFSAGGRSQWKLQVDGEAGHPSCVLVGSADDQVAVRAPDGVADGVWHDVECVREGGELTILVDGAEVRRAPVPDSLVVEPPGAVRVGGKSIKEDNDQYFGVVDDVFLAIA